MPEYRIVCSREHLEAQQHDPRLHRITTLARITNSLRFARDAAFDRNGHETAAASRQRAGSFFYTTGLLYEGLIFADRLGEHFRDSPAFREGFAKLLKDPTTTMLRQGLLNRLRNKAIYHHDDIVMETGIPQVRGPEAVFLRANGQRPSDTNYELGDIAVFRFAVGEDLDSDAFLRAAAAAMADVVFLAERYATAADLLIRETLIALGWRWEESADGAP